MDGLILGKEAGLSGIPECKAGDTYSMSEGDAEKMKHAYIRHFRNKSIGRQPCS